jgi:hypothetical protein
MKTRYDHLAGFQEGNTNWLHHPARNRGKSPKLQPSWEDTCQMITQIIDVVCRIQQHPRVKIMVVHLDRLGPYLGATGDEQP